MIKFGGKNHEKKKSKKKKRENTAFRPNNTLA